MADSSPALPLKTRLLSFFLDWLVWGYVAYGVMYLLNHYWYTVHVDWYGTLTLPAWGWPLVVAGTLEMAALCRALGRSLGQRVWGLNVVSVSGARPRLGQRLRRAVVWSLTVPVQPAFAVLRRPLLHEVLSGTRLVPAPRASGTPARAALLTQWGVMSVFLAVFTIWLGWLIAEVNVPVLFERLRPVSTTRDARVPALRSGEATTLRVPATLAEARQVFTVTADPQGRVAESDTVNNTQRITLDLNASRPDLVIEAIIPRSWDRSRGLGQPFEVEVVVRNQGPADAGPFMVRLQTGETAYDAGVSALPGREAVSISYPVVLTTSPQVFTAIADVGNEVAESDATNNAQRLTLDLATAGPDLVISSITHSPLNPDLGRGQPVTLTVVVRNQGTADAGPFVVRTGWTETSRVVEMWRELGNPDFEYFLQPDPVFVRRGLSHSILNLMVVTIFMALLATVLGALFAFPVSFAGARNIMGFNAAGWAVYGLVRGFFNVFRSIETILWASVFAVWVGWGTFAGVLALTIHTIAALGKLYSEQVESIDPGPLEAVLAVGGSRWEVIRHAVIPQVIPSFWAFTLYRWDINVRMSTIIALVGGGGIGDMLFLYKDEGMWGKVGAVVICIVVVVWLMDYISGRLRERIT